MAIDGGKRRMNTRCGQPDQLRDLVVTHTTWIRASVYARSINDTSLWPGLATTTTIPNTEIYPDYYYYYYYFFRFIAVALVTLARFPRWLAL